MARIFKMAEDGVTQDDKARGVLVKGEKYTIVQDEPGSYIICLRKDGHTSKKIVFAVAATCMVAGLAEAGARENTKERVFIVRDYLKQNGF